VIFANGSLQHVSWWPWVSSDALNYSQLHWQTILRSSNKLPVKDIVHLHSSLNFP
jgi:hypothetical protein